MRQNLFAVTLVVPDYDEAIAFYTQKLQFALTQDVDLGHGKRWVRVTPPGGQASLLLAKAQGAEQQASPAMNPTAPSPFGATRSETAGT